MSKELEKKWGLPTALAMVIGIVIGSGIFFKAVKVLSLTNGNMRNALLVIGIVGLICIICSSVFAILGKKYYKCNGLIDYAEATCGKKYAYFIGWFSSTVYNPVIAATLSYIAAAYFCMMIGLDMYGQANTGFSILFVFIIIVINMLSPKLAGKIQVSTTVIKLTPIVLMGVIGSIIGIINGNGIEVFQIAQTTNASSSFDGVFAGVCAFAFAYEGWISATTINSELKNPQRDLPLALIIGGIFCTLIYMLYVYSMSATLTPTEIIACGDNLPKITFSNVFGNVAGNVILAFIVISCLGTANGMTMCTLRGFYSLAIRDKGPKPQALSTVDETTGMPLVSSIVGIGLIGFWLFQFSTLCMQGPLVYNGTHNPEWLLAWEADEIIIVTMYILYVPIFLSMIIKEKELNVFKRFVLPILAIICSIFMSYCAYVAYGIQTVYYLVTFVIIQGIGMYFYRDKHFYDYFREVRNRRRKRKSINQ